MASACGRYRIIFNGEIYNHLQLRAALPRADWRGHSDTETLLECLAYWGVEEALRRSVGMFALALFDTHERRLVLARDRFGEKPLYYGYAGASFVFASELRALRATPDLDRTINRAALVQFMRHSYVPAPDSIYSSISKLPGGTWLELTEADIVARATPQPRPYWSAEAVAARAMREPLRIDEAEAVGELDRILTEAIRGQMIADVPLGAFLSGGVDSSTIVALMQRESARPVRTFSVGFREQDYDESRFARAVARHLATDHTEMIVGPQELLAVVPRITQVYDEPFADSSQLPTLLVASLARQHVKVALSGDAGDELFAGYQRYFLAPRIWFGLSLAPRAVRSVLAQTLRALSATSPRALPGTTWVAPAPKRPNILSDRFFKAADLLECSDQRELYGRLMSYWWRQAVVIGSAPAAAERAAGHWPKLPGTLAQMMLHDAMTYLPDDILVKVDRAAMAVSLETRIPLLDHRVFEFVWRLPLRMKVRAGRSKWLLRQLLYRHVPRALIERPKMGFAVPLASWLRGPLHDWAQELLQEPRLRQQGYLDANLITRRWQEHLDGTRNWHHELWNVLMFQTWLTAEQ
jgi:asparagine synthase (glutamine-hydrolysing)